MLATTHARDRPGSAQEHPAHGALYRAGAGQVQELLPIGLRQPGAASQFVWATVRDLAGCSTTLSPTPSRDETSRVLDVALERTRAALGLADDFANGVIARQILELARAGERNPDLLCEGALKKLGGALFGD
jgi:hypothetical protein